MGWVMALVAAYKIYACSRQQTHLHSVIHNRSVTLKTSQHRMQPHVAVRASCPRHRFALHPRTLPS